MICPEDLDIELFVINVDPMWTDHFLCIDQAFEHYWKYMEPAEKQQTMKEARG